MSKKYNIPVLKLEDCLEEALAQFLVLDSIENEQERIFIRDLFEDREIIYENFVNKSVEVREELLKASPLPEYLKNVIKAVKWRLA